MQLNKEISEAISSVQITDPEEEEDLETALKELEQQALDDKMISAPAVPVGTHGSAISAKPGKTTFRWKLLVT